MPKYKFTRSYIVEAPTDEEGQKLVKENPTKYLTYASTTVLEESKPRDQWVSDLKRQITGK